MHRILCSLVVVSALVAPLAACSSMGDFAIDPAEWMPDDLFGNKKKLPGERRAVFPEGVPGVDRGIPPDLVKGYQQPDGANDTAGLIEAEPEPPPKPKAKPKPKPKVAARPAPVEPDRRPAPTAARPVQQQGPTATRWPDAPAARPGGGVQWPDP